MKKLLAIALTTVLATACTTGVAVAAAATDSSDETAQVYLMPGSWYNGEKKMTVYNTVPQTAQISDAQKAELHLEGNVYKTGKAGTALPAAVTSQEGRTFNGWWYIVDATITYTEVVPEVTATTYLYADFRAALSQRLDPVAPKGESVESYQHYLRIIHTDKTEDIHELYVSGTDVADAATAGYGGPVQFYNEWFELQPGDLLQVYVTGFGDTGKPKAMPNLDSAYAQIQFETGGRSRSYDYVKKVGETTGAQSASFAGATETPTLEYYYKEGGYFRTYIKFTLDDGGRMMFYLEKK